MTVESQFTSAKQSFRFTHEKKNNKTKENAKQKIPTKTVNAIRQPCPLQSGTTRGGTAGSCTFFLQPLLKMPWKSAAGCTAIPRNRASGLFPLGCWDFISAWDSKLLTRWELKPLVNQTHRRDKGKGAFESLWGSGERAQWVRAPPAKLDDPSTVPESYIEGQCHLPQVVP